MKGLLNIEVNGQKIIALFGMFAIKLLTEKRKITMNEIGDLFNGVEDDAIKAFDLMVDLLWSGIMNHNLVNGIEEAVNYHKLYNDFGSVPETKYKDIFDKFLETQISGKALSGSNDDMDKEATTPAKKK
ncbi:hypothetical protein [Pedobacter cryoconitis]|uniref:Uncharacterized protein n=1 Tax=Pedobacter cryoconitis TaxID=188932 RepID=A0A327SBH0_9SPHI|nr:hypothetical protein [Pedobacter cryoconitis]RAJ25003.1 hypothetical protein LY11_04190 [Pedobacter cryoconitis]